MPFWSAGSIPGVGIGRPAARRTGLLALLLASLFALSLSASPAQGAYLHNTVIGEYGKEGPAATGVGSGCRIAFHEATDRLYLMSDSKIYGLQINAPGSASPLGGGFPINASGIGGQGTGCGDPDFEVDNSATASNGNLYAAPSGSTISGWSSSGTSLPGWPVNSGSGETCGVTVTGNGEVWGGHYTGPAVVKFNSSGVSTGELPIDTSFCKLTVDKTNGDLYVQPYSSSPIRKYTAASGYSSFTTPFPESGDSNAGFTISGATNRIYIGNGSSTVKSYDTATGALVEEIPLGASGGRGIAIDESTDTLYVVAGGVIKEISGQIVPDIVTGDPVGNKDVSGTVDDAGGGPITECYFEYGTTTSYGSKQDCAQTPPFGENPQAVTANIPSLEGEVLYHYRLVAHNANGRNTGADKTIEPHNVQALATKPATNITRTSARLNGSFEGTNEATSYYFEWEQNTTGGPDSCPCANSTPVKNVPANTSLNEIFDDISGLTAGKKYIFRVVAENSKGISKAQTLEFTTSPAVNDLTTLPATDVGTEGATLNASLDPDGFATTYYFEWGKDDKYGQAVPLPPGNSVADTSPGIKSVSVPLTDLEPGTEYHFRVVAKNVTGETVGGDQSFVTRQPPSITSTSATEITATTANLVGTINPNGYETTYYFEYGPTKDYGTKEPIPVGVLPAGNAVVDVLEAIEGLEKRTYHFRLVASNEWGTVTSEDQSFDFKAPTGCPNHVLRQQTGAAYLPDCRAYELVSPANAGGALLFPQGPIAPYAAGKFGFAGWITTIPGSGEPQNADFNHKDLYVATRGNNGWHTRYVGVPGSEGLLTSNAPACEYGGCQSLSYGPYGVNYPDGVMTDKTMEHLVLWDRKGMALLNQPFPTEGNNGPLVFDNEGNRVAKLPTNFDEVPGADTDLVEGGWIGSARISPDYSNYAFSSIRTAFASDGLTEEPGSVYDNDLKTGTVTVVSKTEDGQDIPQDLNAGRPVEFIRIPGISDDGSHILMAAAAPPFQFFRFAPKLSHLYMAVNNGDGTYEHYDISVDKDGNNVGVDFENTTYGVDIGGEENGHTARMTSDGSKVYFRTDQKMTADDTDTSIDLYVWEEATNDLTRISDSGNIPGNTDSCSASWIAKCGVEPVAQVIENFQGEGTTFSDSEMAKDSGDYYFYSPELLDGARGFPGKRNLYVYREGKAQFVASFEPGKEIERINISPDGSFMGFITKTRLTAYDNAGHSMMYVYNAEARTIKCVSCLPSGAPPAHDALGSTNGWFMAFDGRAFWSTKDALVPPDANNAIDTYEYVDGRPQLISTGTGKEPLNQSQDLGLVHVTGDGVDVIFATTDTLVRQDENGDQYKFYTAHTNGGFAPPVDEPPCAAADECHGEDSSAPAMPEIGTGAYLGNRGNHPPHRRKRCRRKGKARTGARASKKGRGKNRCRSARRKKNRGARRAGRSHG